MEATFCFVDIAGFTALTETHGAAAAADLIDRFLEIVGDALPEEGRLVDRAGDAVFVVLPSPEAGFDFLRALWAAAEREPDFPVLRAGLHRGDALERDGAYFGPDVNLAARVAAQAGGGRIVTTKAVADAARAANLPLTPLGTRPLRNIREPVDLFSIELAVEGTSPIDPVCRMRVDPESAPGRLRFEDREYWFCSLHCAALFAEAPKSYLDLDAG